LPVHYGGLEVPGAGLVKVNGDVYVNTQWGGLDQNNRIVGIGPAPPYAIACMPLIPTTCLKARDIRVVGGGDRLPNYPSFASNQASPLRAGKSPVKDPLKTLPAPSLASDRTHVTPTSFGGVSVVAIPLIGTRTLSPGVYDWIEIVSGNVKFNPGVYVIRGR